MKAPTGLALLLAAVAALSAKAGELGARDRERLAPFAGDYQGAFDTALTATPLDDMNINPCRDCETHAEPLKDIYLHLAVGGDRLRVSFRREPGGADFDLLGKYCRSAIGEMKSLDTVEGEGKDSGDKYSVTTATFAFDPGRCPRNIAQNKAPELILALTENHTRDLRFARVEIDRDLRRVVTLTAEDEDGERVEVKSNPNDYGRDRGETRSYLYEDELGDFSRRRSNTTETRYFAIPVALNGYVGANLTWWPHKILDVEAETEEVLTRHTGVFMPVPEDSPPGGESPLPPG